MPDDNNAWRRHKNILEAKLRPRKDSDASDNQVNQMNNI